MKSRDPLISVIIVHYNGRECLEDSLGSLKKQTYTNFEIIIVDNGSMDDSVPFVRKTYPEVEVIYSKKNNFCAGNNIGIEKALGKYVLILNNDTELHSNCLEHLAMAVESSDHTVGMWATKILNYYDRTLIDSTGLVIYPDGISRGRGRLEKDSGQFDLTEEVCFPSGCAGLYNKDILKSLGSFDEDFEFYLEDSDVGFRFRLAGWKCIYIPEAKIYHKYSFSMGKYSPRKVFLIERNRIWLLIKNYPISLLVLTPFYTLKRYSFQFYGMITGKGATSRFTQQYSPLKLFILVLKSWTSVLSRIILMFKKRARSKSKMRISSSEFKSLFNKFALSTSDLSFKE